MSLDIGFAGQVPSLPAGSGSLGGLGETFTPDLSTGSGALTVPFELPHGPNDIGPKLALRYDTGAPNGPFGVGWSLPLPRLLRTTMRGIPRYTDADALVLEGSGPLVRLPDGTLRPEVDTGDWRVDASGDGFLVTDRAGIRYELGLTPDSRIPGVGGAPWSWLLHAIEDNLGYRAEFSWLADGAQRYLETVQYGPFEVRLAYESRPDPLRFGRGGFLLETALRCSSVALRLPAEPQPAVRRWDIAYEQGAPSGSSRLASVTLVGTAADGTELAASPLTLRYSLPGSPRVVRIDPLDPGASPPGLEDGPGRVDLVDWTGDGTADVVAFAPDGSARVWPNRCGRWGRPASVGLVPYLAGPSARAGLIDIDGDGIADVVRVDRPLGGYQPRSADGFERPVGWLRAPSVAPGAPGSRLADLDGDGIPDLLWTAGTSLLIAHRDEGRGGWDPMPVVVPGRQGGPPTSLADPRIRLADMTGDGVPDLVRIDGGGVTYWPYLGDGVFGDPVAMAGSPDLPFDTDPARVLLVDIDGDGCADVVHLADGVARWWPNRTGAAFADPVVIRGLPTGALTSIRVADLTGAGVAGVAWSVRLPSGRSRWFTLDIAGGVRPGLLETVDNGVGAVTTIAYRTSAQEAERDRAAGVPWPSRLPIVLPVVASITVRDVASGAVTETQYRYHDGRYDGILREVCGFGRTETIDVGDADVAALVTVQVFENGAVDGAEPATVDARRRARAIRGRLRRVDRLAQDGTLLDRVETDWLVSDGVPGLTVAPRLAGTTRSVFEGAASPVSRTATEQVAWDADGNVTESRERVYAGLAATPIAELQTHVEYASDPTGRFRQRQWLVRQADGAGTVLAETRTRYDGLAEGSVGTGGVVSGRAALAIPDALATDVYGADQPDHAALGYARRPATAGWWVELGTYERTADATGVHGRVTGPRGGVSRLDFDATGCYPVRAQDALGHVLSATFDLRAYQPVSVTDPSGATSTAQFDALARLVARVDPGDTAAEPTTAWRYDTAARPIAVTEERAAGGGLPPVTERQFLDGLGRLLERRQTIDTGELITATHRYGARGMLTRTFTARAAADAAFASPADAAPHATIAYDPLGRVVRTVRADGAVSTVRYLPGSIEQLDEEQARTDPGAPHAGALTRRILDATGRVVRTEQVTAGGTLVSTDTFNLKGSVVEHVDASGAATRFTYDLLGRVLRVQRPEATQVAVLDPSGNCVEARNGAARVLRSFDIGDRVVAVRHDSPASAPVARYTYHDPGPPPPDAGSGTSGGRLIRVDDEAGSTVLDYDLRGRISRKTMQPAGGPSLVLETSYRSDGLVAAVTYPGGVGIAYAYDRAGRLASVSGVIDGIDYDEFGHRVRTRYANGTEQLDAHDATTGWRTSASLSGPAGSLRAVSYRHDLVGNLLEISSPDPGLQAAYTYDNLYRLVSATGPGGPAAFTYDASGNLTSMPGAGAFAYGQGGMAATLLSSAGTGAFAYDARGHVTAAPWGTHQVDAAGRLRRIDLAAGGHEELDYGHSGLLVRRRSVDAGGAVSEVLTPDRLVAIEDGTLVLALSDGERVVAVQRGVARTWLHTDHLGSIVMATDATGAVAGSWSYGPYGQRISAAGMDQATAFATGRGGPAGLLLLGLRWYSPQVGRFLSPDPIVGDASDPMAWNAYAYARCNPTTYVDPTGRDFWKIFGAVLATIAIIAVVVVVSVFTFGIASPGAVALGVGGITVTWGAVFAATMVGVVAGGIIGGIAAARAGGDAGDIVLGVLVGGAVGGWAAFGAAFAGVAVAGGLGLTAGSVGAGAVAGGVAGAINGAAMGFAAGFAGGRNNGLKDIMEKVLVGAIVGAALGAALGALSGLTPPKGETPLQSAERALRPDVPSGQPSAIPSSVPSAPSAPVNSFGDAVGQTATGIGGKVAGALLPHAAAATSGITGSIITQTIVVDIGAAAASGWWDDLQAYLRTHNVSLGPFDFIKGDW